MTTKTRAKPPTGTDDLTLVHGIGATTAARLQDAGIATFERLARTAPSELSAVLEGTVRRSPQRITAEGWTTQAATLAADRPQRGRRTSTTDRDVRPARYSFTVTLLVDIASREVVSSKVIDGQTNDTVTAPGWDINALMAYITERAGLADDHKDVSHSTQRSRRPLQPGAAAPVGAPTGYPFARGSAPLPSIQPGETPGAVHVGFAPTSLPSAVPARSYAVIEVHAPRPPEGVSVLGRTTTELRGQQPVDVNVPIVVPTSKAPIAGRVTLWVIAPGTRPKSQAAAIPSLDLSVNIELPQKILVNQ